MKYILFIMFAVSAYGADGLAGKVGLFGKVGLNQGGAAAASITFSKTNAFGDTASSTTVAVTVTGVPAGALAVAVVSHYESGTTITCSDGTSMTSARKHTHSAAEGEMEVFYKLSSAGGDTTYTATFGVAKTHRDIQVYIYTYTGSISLDSVNSNESNGGTGSVTSGNITTTANVNVAVAGYMDNAFGNVSTKQINAVTGTHLIESTVLQESWDLISASTYTGQATGTSTVSVWICTLVSFKAQ